uniref:Receptor ser thr protein kinase n=1 Tax=Solanum tuberosum TaxID=4113 RepID=M1AFU7_SOLTU
MGWNCFGVLQSYKNNRETQIQEFTTNNVRVFSYNSLRSATGHFHPSNKIGGGGFGVVYKGVLRDGTCVAIKCLSAESKQGTKEFLTEINMISNTQHPNLVQLIGCCVESGNRMLIYEYLKNNSLASALLGSNGKRVALNWPQRVAICLGTASGLAFLHEEASPPIVHRDIKASNILIDENLHPKIGDFGLAKLFPENVTHLSTRVAGTIGYLAPEYALFGQLTKKADVYSFGVLVLEIISGRSSSKSAFGVELLVLVEWVGLYFQLYDLQDSSVISILKVYALQVWKLREEGQLLEIIDPELTEYPETELLRFIKVALFCTQAAPTQRPNMKQVIEMLSKEVNLNEKSLTEPGVYRPHSSKRSSYGSLQKSSSAGKNGVQSVNPFVTSTKFESFQSVTQMLPR